MSTPIAPAHAAVLHLDHVECHEGDGLCTECQREGLTWVAVLSDGRHVGLECVKKVLGFRLRPRDHSWQQHFYLFATHREGAARTYGLWRARSGAQTRETLNGRLTAVGGMRAEWVARGWL